MIVKNRNRYLSSGIVNDCFRTGFTLVDKQRTGNGFTYQFLKLPPEQDKINVIIVPNRQVIASKQMTNNNDKIGFIYGEDINGKFKSDKLDFDKFNTLMFVADSFLNKLNLLVKNKHRIDKILIDEAHSILIQSSFREKLKNFTKTVKENFTEQKVVSVTATPMLFQEPDIVIKNEVQEETVLNVTSNEIASFNRLQDSIKKGNNVILATNDVNVIDRLKDKKTRVLRANFKVGKNLKKSIVERLVIEQDEESKLTIISSTGFEGFDVNNGLNDVFIFENRRTDFNSFYVQNIVQILGRSRKGNNYVELCTQGVNKQKEEFKREQIIKKIESKRISNFKKLSDKNYKKIRRFFYPEDFVFNDNKEAELKIIFDETEFNLYEESRDLDSKGFDLYLEYLTDRRISINYLKEHTDLLKNKLVIERIKKENISKNLQYIKKENVFLNEYLSVINFDKRTDALRHFKKYIRRKYYTFVNEEKPLTLNEERVFELLSNENNLNRYCNEIYKHYISSKKFTEERERAKKIEFKENIKSIVIRLLLMVANDKITLPKKEIVWRDYNLLTEVSIVVLEKLKNDFNLTIEEIDIVSCNPRIIYAFCGLDLPDNFYGVNKENKTKINKALNSLAYNKSYNTSAKDQKQNNKKKLIKLGFDEKVIDWLIERFFDASKDSLFNWCAYQEKQIIKKLKKQYIEVNGKETNASFIRRHDSLIVFGTANKPKEEFEYLGFKNWFKHDENSGLENCNF